MLNKEEFRKYAEKHRINECAEYFGVSSSYVSFYAKKNNITVAKKNDAYANKIIELAERGLTRQQIADELKLKYMQVVYVLKKADIKAVHADGMTGNFTDKERLKQIRCLYENGFSLQGIADLFGVSKQRISQICMKYGGSIHNKQKRKNTNNQ